MRVATIWSSRSVRIAGALLLLAGCGVGQGPGGNRRLEVRNFTTDAVLTGAELRDASDAVVASFTFVVPPTTTWTGSFSCPSGSYYRVTYGTALDGGGACVDDQREDLPEPTPLDDDDLSLIWIFQGTFCDGGD